MSANNLLLIKAQADFAINLLSNVVFKNKPVESTIISPLSLSMALAMVYVGADGETNEEFGKLLSGGLPEKETHAYFGKLFDSYNNNKAKNYTLDVANKIFTQEGFKILEDFINLIKIYYGGQFQQLNFAKNVEAAKIINDFVEKATKNKIKDLISSDSLSSDTRLVLVNAVYFKGKWASTFNSNYTHKKVFYVNEDQTKEVEMMSKTDNFVYFENNEMPYAGDSKDEEEISMYFLLPKERFGLQKMIENLNGESLLELFNSGRKERVEVLIPKYKLESTHNLNEILQNMGLTKAFGNEANFSKITKEEPLKISKVLQKAFIEVNEKGTEAAAATGIIVIRVSAIIFIPVTNPKFIADHPFAFMLINNENEILFNGIFQG
ncbi:SERPIN domain-containing protein [Meloidogyne graminicola]|uniref:SERPIN domain-containing protein n=1 Tax=Meloidogyne graminicola TaxID=189291 RepID=A0A8S9ZLA3_9BILA|nr:SERPIN domain-containing protein [Meloidogyne graminicola]